MIEHKISIKSLRPGMYVSSLDRPWAGTPFSDQGFLVEESGVIELLKSYCQHLFIDAERGIGVENSSDETSKEGGDAGNDVPLSYASEESDVELKVTDYDQSLVYKDSASLVEESPIAKKIYIEIFDQLSEIMEDVRTGRKVQVSSLSMSISSMVESIIRNPDAFFWLTKLKQKELYAHSHALNTCILTIVFGRHLGLSNRILKAIAMGALMLDVGKIECPKEILSKPDTLTPEEFEKIKRHVEYGLNIISDIPGVSTVAVEMVRCHHERHDGSGYPQGLRGNDIPIYSRIVALVDCYDAMTSHRHHSAATSSHEVLEMIYKWSNTLFQAKLIEPFIQCLGIYPIGTVVELSSGEVAIVVALNRTRRLSPKVVLILDQNKQKYEEFKEIDLMEQQEGRGVERKIVSRLEPGSFGVDPDKLRFCSYQL